VLPKPQRRALTSTLIRGPKSSAELELLTGVPRSTVPHHRELIGIVRDERQRPDMSWLPLARRLLGKVTDKEIAQDAGVAARIVTDARRKLGIAQTLKKSMATGEVRDRLRRMSKRELRQVLAALAPIDAKIVEARYLNARPVPLAQLGASPGISRQRVAQRERRAVARCLGNVVHA
jgi:DNA-directed RNA polymerase specialized sigma subunit